ncbi:unnamed protein product, partial [Adineta ricciae]
MIVLLLAFLPLCICTTPYLLRSYPTESTVVQFPFKNVPCEEPIKKLEFLQNTDVDSLNHTECSHNEDESLLICKLGVGNTTDSLKLDNYPIDKITIVILFVQQFLSVKPIPRVLDLCFLNRFSQPLQELAICGYQPSINVQNQYPYLHILDVPTLAIAASNIHTLLISGICVDVWQSVELRQMKSLKHLLIIQGATMQMRYYHSPHCADCVDAHPKADYSFHYLIHLSSQLTYFLYDSPYKYTSCQYDLLKTIRSDLKQISTFIVASDSFNADLDNPICKTCQSGLCPLLAVCLDETSKTRRDSQEPFECLCVEELAVEDEFKSCKPMTLHPPMYSTRCNHTPSIWNYISRSMIVAASYYLCSLIAFIGSTIFLL